MKYYILYSCLMIIDNEHYTCISKNRNKMFIYISYKTLCSAKIYKKHTSVLNIESFSPKT